jgi:hypothetical protein
MSEGTGGYPGLGYERVTDEVDPAAVALQDADEVREGSVAVGDG